MKSLKGSIALICIVGIYATGALAYAGPDSQMDSQVDSRIDSSSDPDQNSATKNTGQASSILTYFNQRPVNQRPVNQKSVNKNVVPEVVLIEKPTRENAGQYITLYEPDTGLGLKEAHKHPQKKLSIKHSFAVKPSPIFNMGNAGLLSAPPSGFAGYGATTAGNRITFSYGNDGLAQDPGALGISIGSQFLVEPSQIMSPLFDGSEYDRANNRQVYNLSVDMGYAGFRLGASFSRERMLNDPGLKGFDIGLGYNGSKWGADVRFGAYKRERDLLFASTEDFYSRVSALEIGAAYQLFSNIRFTGRFTYYSYGHENNLDKLRNSQVFFLGTNVNF